MININKIKQFLTHSKELNDQVLKVFGSLDMKIKDYVNSSEVYEAIQDLQSQRNIEEYKESEESKRIRSNIQILENINFGNDN